MKEKSRNKKLAFNTISSLGNQFITVLCGLILPRFILASYGSDVNGLVSSISQFLSFISLLDLGVGAVIQSAYYKPLAENDKKKISLIYNESKKFFRGIALILVGYVFVLCIVFPKAINSTFDRWYIITLILSIAISYFAQYYFAVKNQLLLNADQRLYIQSNIHIITIVLNTVISILLIKLGCSIHLVKLTASIIFIIRPIVIAIYVRKNYDIDAKAKQIGFKIEQKWNGMAQHCATVVMDNTDVIILTLCTDIKYVSVYSVYSMVALGIRQFITSLGNGFTPVFGELYAKNRGKELNVYFDTFEWALNTITTIIYTVTGVLIVPFILNYTRGVTDISYNQVVFATFLTVAHAIYCLRIPYNSMVNAAGHYRQTQKSAIIEMSINLIVSFALVSAFGLIGVAIGTLTAVIYRTLYFIWYLKKNVLQRDYNKCIKQVAVDGIIVASSMFMWFVIPSFIDPTLSYANWIVYAIYVTALVASISVVINIIAYKNTMMTVLTKLLHKAKQ